MFPVATVPTLCVGTGAKRHNVKLISLLRLVPTLYDLPKTHEQLDIQICSNASK
jgi:hypothetical protein